ncbi:MAG: DUF6477 family protein [Pseudomonadota bacterium]
MPNSLQLLNALRRPRLLIDAARHGLRDYRRERLLQRLLGTAVIPGPRRAVAALLACEDMLEQARRAKDTTYNPARHIEVLVALVAEAREAHESAQADVPAGTEETRRPLRAVV